MAFHVGLRRMNKFLSGGGDDSFLRHTGKVCTMAHSLLKCMGYLGHNELSAMTPAIQRSYTSETGNRG